MKKEYTPPRDKFGAVVKQEPARAEFAGGGTLRAADLTKESFQPDWEPMAVPVWETIVNAVLTRVPNYLYQELVHARLAQVETVPDWDRHWICHPDAFEGLVSHPDFCFPGDSSPPAPVPEPQSASIGSAAQEERSPKPEFVSGREIMAKGTLTRREYDYVVQDDRDNGRLSKWLRAADLITDKHDDPSKRGLLFRHAPASEWREVLAKDTFFTRRNPHPRQKRRDPERPVPT